MTVFILVVLLGLLILGVPIAFALAITGTSMLFFYNLASLDFVPQTMFSCLNSFTLLCIPYFFLASNIMMKGELAKYILDFMSGATRSIYGGKAVAITVTAALFGAITGSSVACTAAVGTVGYPFLQEEKYPNGWSQALISTVGAMGIMIPPSLCFILYGAVTGESIGTLFIAGVIPGILETVAVCALVYVMAKKFKWGARGDFAAVREWAITFVKAFWAILMPVIILGGIYSGMFTPTEAAAAAAVYSFVVAAFVYKNMSMKEFMRILNESAINTAMVMFVLVGAMLFGYACTYARIPIIVSEWVAGAGLNNWQFLSLIILFMMILGCFLDGVSIILICTPILYPILPSVNVNPIHFGVVLTALIEIAQITPPVGLNMFVMAAIAKAPVQEQFRWIPPFFILRFCFVLAITYVPVLSLWLTRVVY